MKKGFTLAEVLITLTVIGVIAALTIPTLIQDIQDAQLKTAWKREYSDINQAVRSIMQDNGGTMVGLSESDFANQFLSKLNYVKYCPKTMGNGGNCWPDNVVCLNGTTTCSYSITTLDAHMFSSILNNGSLIVYDWVDSTCTTTVNWGRSYPVCGAVFVDVNGFKGPNTMGKDIFGMSIVENGVLPWGAMQFNGYGSFNANTCNKSLSGWGCSALYLMQ